MINSNSFLFDTFQFIVKLQRYNSVIDFSKTFQTKEISKDH